MTNADKHNAENMKKICLRIYRDYASCTQRTAYDFVKDHPTLSKLTMSLAMQILRMGSHIAFCERQIKND